MKNQKKQTLEARLAGILTAQLLRDSSDISEAISKEVVEWASYPWDGFNYLFVPENVELVFEIKEEQVASVPISEMFGKLQDCIENMTEKDKTELRNLLHSTLKKIKPAQTSSKTPPCAAP